MRNRGNNAVAPTKDALELFKGSEDWQAYVNWYQGDKLETEAAKEWMRNVAEETVARDVVLVCYEKNHLRCHRSLLAKQIVQNHPEVNYVGELRFHIWRARTGTVRSLNPSSFFGVINLKTDVSRHRTGHPESG